MVKDSDNRESGLGNRSKSHVEGYASFESKLNRNQLVRVKLSLQIATVARYIRHFKAILVFNPIFRLSLNLLNANMSTL
jgi:uncharacterized protein YjcR